MLVIGFLEGETLSDEHLQAPGMLPRVAEACRRLHAGPAFVNRFDMFELQPDYLARVQRRGFRLPPGYLDHAETVERIRRALAVRPVALRPCHNDLLAANFIDDGRTVSIIDYEYSGNNDPYFELGNIWSECHLTLEQLEELVEAYDGSLPRAATWRGPACGVSCPSTDGRCGRPSRTARARSISTSGIGGWRSTSGPRPPSRGPDLERLLVDVTRAD